MIIQHGDLWQTDGAKVIPTNGIYRDLASGGARAVMGAGVALAAKRRYPDLDLELGRLLKRYGNRVHILIYASRVDSVEAIYTFPTKHHYRDRADLALIECSARQLAEAAQPSPRVVLPWPGCGLGGLRPEQVQPILERHLDDHFVLVDNRPINGSNERG